MYTIAENLLLCTFQKAGYLGARGGKTEQETRLRIVRRMPLVGCRRRIRTVDEHMESNRGDRGIRQVQLLNLGHKIDPLIGHFNESARLLVRKILGYGPGRRAYEAVASVIPGKDDMGA